MPRAASDNTVQVSIRVPEGVIGRADALAAAHNRRGMLGRATRADILRTAVMRGLGAIETEHAAITTETDLSAKRRRTRQS